VGWQIYQLTRDPLALGLVGLSEALAFISFALWAGHVSDRSEKRRLILRAQGVIFLGALALWVMSCLHNTRILPMYAVIALTGVARTFLWSSNTTYSQMIVPREIYSSAAAWNSSVWEIASILGPAIGGLAYGLWGAPAAYGLALGLIGLSLFFASQLRRLPPVPTELQEPLTRSLTTGLRFVFNHPIVLGAMALDMFAVLFGGVVALLPIFAETLRVGPTGLGLLRAAQSLGAILMAIVQIRRPPFQNTGKTLLAAVALFGICIIAFGLSQNFYLSMALLALAGAADNISVVIRGSIYQAATPDAMRGRVSAVNGIFVGSSNELGAFESGLAAKLIGTVPAVLFGGVMTLLTVAWTTWKFPQLKKLKRVSDLGSSG
jgi:MFS family permease